MKSFLMSKAAAAGTAVPGILLSGEVSGFKDVLNVIVCGFGAILVLKGVHAMSEGQGENNAASKAQGLGFIGGGVIFIVAGLMVVDYLFGLM